jgi:lycopene cyclase domain-containing protein
MKNLYLWINILTLFFPLVLSFDKKVAFYKKWPFLFPAILLTAIIFLVWDHYFTLAGVWGFNRMYVTGYFVGSLPIEELLFFVTVPYACVFIYECLKAYFPTKFDLLILTRYIPIAFVVVVLVLISLNFTAIYSTVTGVFLLVLFGLKTVRTKDFLRFFVPTYLISFLPMFVVNGFLTAKPVVYYHPNSFSGMRLGTIPIEDFFYNAAMLLLCMFFYLWFQKFKKKQAQTTETDSD